jgi:hypothetical protein
MDSHLQLIPPHSPIAISLLYFDYTRYAKDEQLFFRDFGQAFGKLLSLGCPASCQPNFTAPAQNERDKLNAEFRELAMHGSVVPAMQIAAKCDVHQVESTSGRSALHKAAFWGHNKMVEYHINYYTL